MGVATLIEVNPDGAITIPRDMARVLGLRPRDKIRLERRSDGVRLFRIKARPVSLTAEDRRRWEQITRLLQETFADADWNEIHKMRFTT